jgi:hypothetical protein
MLNNLPTYISVIFGITTLVTIWLFYYASKKSIRTLIILSIWIILQGYVALTGFYTNTASFPPRFLLLVIPAFSAIVILFSTKSGINYIDNFSIEKLTILHTIRIPVEIVLFWLFLQKTIPQLMTFEGLNWDILSGITAPVIYYFAFVKKVFGNKVLLIWNIVCLLLLINIVVIAILSASFSFQKLAFHQPNIAVLHFPFIWLPCSVVPIVLFSHLVVIRAYFKKN